MKRSFVGSGILALILGVLAFVAPVHAAPAQQNGALPPEVTDIEWTLVSLQPPGEAVENTTGQGLTLRFGAENAANGSGGCNVFSTTYSVGDAQNLSFAVIAGTLRSCGDAADMLERRYLQTLQAVTAYSLADGRLTLTTEDGGELVYASGATTQQNSALPPEVTDIEWMLVSLQASGEAAEDAAGQGLTLRFGPENAANGSGGCNTFNTTYSVGDAQSLSFTPIASTRRSCGEATDMRERRYFQTLQAVTAYSLADDRLTLTDGGSGELVYASQATTQPILLPTTGSNEYGPLWMMLVAALSAAAGLGLRCCKRCR
jgi:heat shock protein HslJ